MDSLNKFFKSVWGKSLLILIIWNIAIRLIAVLGYFILPERFAPLDFLASFWKTNFMFWSFANFDGEHYLSIAKFGYQIRSGFPQYAFFPLFPSLVHLTATLIRDYYLSAVLVSQFSLYLALVYITKWCNSLKLPDIRLLLLLSTGAIFLASIYTEPLFIALASMTMYFSEKKWWGSAVLTTALATATRVNGIFLALFLFVKLLKAKKGFLTSSLYSLAASSGVFTYMFYLWQKTGDGLAWFHAQGSWGKGTATSPFITFVSYFKSLTTEFTPDLVHLVVTFEVLATIVAIILFIKLLRQRQLDISYWLYLAGNLAMPIMTGSLGSMPRFVLILFPLLVVVPKLSGSGKTLYYISSIIVSIAGIILFTRGYWYG
jgi:hypothetical protein